MKEKLIAVLAAREKEKKEKGNNLPFVHFSSDGEGNFSLSGDVLKEKDAEIVDWLKSQSTKKNEVRWGNRYTSPFPWDGEEFHFLARNPTLAWLIQDVESEEWGGLIIRRWEGQLALPT